MDAGGRGEKKETSGDGTERSCDGRGGGAKAAHPFSWRLQAQAAATVAPLEMTGCGGRGHVTRLTMGTAAHRQPRLLLITRIITPWLRGLSCTPGDLFRLSALVLVSVWTGVLVGQQIRSHANTTGPLPPPGGRLQYRTHVLSGDGQ